METRNTNKKSLYVNGTFKSMEEKPYFGMGYLRLFFTVDLRLITDHNSDFYFHKF